MTRACISALSGNFKAAFTYHPLYIILAIETAYYILVYNFEFKKIKLNSKIEMVIGIITALLGKIIGIGFSVILCYAPTVLSIIGVVNQNKLYKNIVENAAKLAQK